MVDWEWRCDHDHGRCNSSYVSTPNVDASQPFLFEALGYGVLLIFFGLNIFVIPFIIFMCKS